MGRRSRLRDALVVLQVALCVVLLAAGGLLARSLRNLRSIDPRMEVDNVLLLSLDPSLNGYDTAAGRRLWGQLLERVGGLPGVVAATTGEVIPFSNSGKSFGRVFGGPQSPDEGVQSDCNLVAPDYFRTMGISLVRGRDFDRRDREGAPRVAVINETLARRLWPGEDALGKLLRVSKPVAEPWGIVGVARDSRYRNATEPARPFYYLPVDQFSLPVFRPATLDVTLHVRTAGNPLALIDPVKRVMGSLMRGTMLHGVSPRDPVAFAAATVLVVAVALAASYIPARRATRVDPLVALRYE